MTPSQRWATKRNFAKRTMRGVSAHLSNLARGWQGETLIDWEKESLKLALARIEIVIRDWDENNSISKRSFLRKED